MVQRRAELRGRVLAKVVACRDDGVAVVEDGKGFGVDLGVDAQDGGVLGTRDDLAEFEGGGEGEDVGVDLGAEFGGEEG